MLLGITAIKGASDLHLLDTKYKALGAGKVIFYLSGKPKHFRKQGGEPDPIVFTSSVDTLCPVGTVKAYLERTTSWRENNSETNSFSVYCATQSCHK